MTGNAKTYVAAPSPPVQGTSFGAQFVLALAGVTSSVVMLLLFQDDLRSYPFFTGALMSAIGLCAAATLFGHKRHLITLYIVLMPVLAAIDRYNADVLYEVPGWIARYGWTQAFILAIGTFAVWSFPFDRDKRHPKGRLSVWILAFFAIVVLSFLTSNPDQFRRFLFLGNFPFYIAFYVVALISLRDGRDVERFVLASYACVVLVVVSRYLYQGFLITNRIDVNYIYGGAVNYSQVLVQALPFGFYFFRFATKDAHRWMFGISIALVLFEILVTKTRGAYISALVGMGFLTWVAGTIRFNVKTVAALVVLVLAGWFFISIRIAEDASALSESAAYRWDQILEYYSVWTGNMVFGLGFGAEYFAESVRIGAHNTFLSVGVDTGLVGVIALTLIYIFAFRSIARTISLSSCSPRQRMLLLTCSAALLAQLAHGMTTGNGLLYHIAVQIIFNLLGIFVILERTSHHAAQGQRVLVR